MATRFAVTFAIAATFACKGGDASSNDSGVLASLESVQVQRARVLGESGPNAPVLPARAEVLALAESVEAQAVREGAGARAADLHTVAARLIERVWRIEGQERDASEALDIYLSAARDVSAPSACSAAIAAAGLKGDVARDPAVTYAELYRAERRFPDVLPARASDAGVGAEDAGAPRSCRRAIDRTLSELVAFRPVRSVLDAIAEDLDRSGESAESRPSAIPLNPSPPVDHEPPRVVRIEAWPGSDTARVVVVLDRPAAYRVGDEVLPERVRGAPTTFIDLDGADLGERPHEEAEQGIVSRVRTEATSTGARVSLDIDGRAWRRVFFMRDPYRIVVDVTRRLPGSRGRGPRDASRVVLDPGHGGKDTGAVGPNGLREKDVTLDIARRVASVLGGQGVSVLLTRDDDRFVSLEERTARANGFGADLFVSIHCNASEDKAHRGVETYVLDTSRDEIAARIAARENATTPATTAELASILGGMRIAEQEQRSAHFAGLLERAASSALETKYGDAVSSAVHTAGFYVLVGAAMPSALFETNYISNPAEEQRLASDEGRQLFADAVVNAVKAYREGR
ncbi:MAG: N-acetylmuramoyl-L-alanine amidase family protein [Polyangiaceae bacterium]